MPNEALKNPVFVLGGSIGGLWMARELGKHGIDVHIASYEKNEIAFHSKYCKKKIRAPGPWTHQDLLKMLKKMAKSTPKRLVVYPLSDIDALNLSIIKEEIPDDFHFVVGKKEATETLVNKHKFYRALEKNGIEYPETFFPQDLANVKQIGKDLKYRIFIRPSISQLFLQLFGPGKGFIANSYEELLNYYNTATSKNVEVMFQQIIDGPPANSYQLEGYFNKKFCHTGLFARQRLRIWPPNFGNTTLCVSIPLSKLTVETKKITDFIKNIEFNGMASAEFKKDPRDGKCKLLEINARPWLHFWLSAKCGINILLSSYLDAIGEQVEHKQEYITGLKSMRLDYDLFASRKMIQKGELTVPEWFFSLKGIKQEVFFTKDDSLPFFVNYTKLLGKSLSYIGKRLGF